MWKAMQRKFAIILDKIRDVMLNVPWFRTGRTTAAATATAEGPAHKGHTLILYLLYPLETNLIILGLNYRKKRRKKTFWVVKMDNCF